MNNNIFQSEDLQEQFDKKGFAVFSLFNDEELHKCLNFYSSVLNDLQFQQGVHNSFNNSDPEQGAFISNYLHKLMEPSLDRVLKNFKNFNSIFIVKSANHDSNSVGLHQDWTCVREDKGFRSGTLWLALVDTYLENGAIGVLPGSHRWWDIFRLVPYNEVPKSLSVCSGWLLKYLQIVKLKAGEAVLFDQALVHASLPNSTNNFRPSITSTVIEADAVLSVASLIPGTGEKVGGFFELEPDYFNTLNYPMLRDKYINGETLNNQHPVKEFAVEEVEFTEEEMKRMLDESGITEINDEIVEYLKELENKRMPVVTETDGEKPSWWKKLFRAG